MERIITNSMIGNFENYLRSDEKSNNTIEKYLRDVRAYASLFEGQISSSQIVQGCERLYVDIQAKRGNSGGPVIDRESGCVVGVLCGSQIEGNSRLVEEINYIRPVKYIWENYVEK